MRPPTSPRPLRRDRGLLSPPSFEGGLRVVLGINLFDALATLFWIEAGLATEANPIMAAALNAGPSLFVLSKIALVSLAIGLLWTHRAQRGARLALVPVGLLYALVAGAHVGFAVHQLVGTLGT